MMMYATQKSFEDVKTEYDGRFAGIPVDCVDENILVYPGALDRIYPDEYRKAKESSEWIIDSFIKQFNETLPDNEKIDRKIKDELICNIVDSNHDFIFSHLYEINKLWFNRGPRWESSIWSQNRSLAVSIESICKEWYNETYLGKILEKAFGSDYASLKNSINYTKITDAETPEEYKQKFDRIYEHQKLNRCGICGHHLVISHLTRNYLSHKNVLEPGMFGAFLQKVATDLVFMLISLFVKRPANTKTK